MCLNVLISSPVLFMMNSAGIENEFFIPRFFCLFWIAKSISLEFPIDKMKHILITYQAP